jgi:hypothetical protein
MLLRAPTIFILPPLFFLSHLVEKRMSSNEDNAFIVQIFTTFASPELNPMLLRLGRDTTVTAAVEAALAKLLQHQALATLPSDAACDYKMCIAGGDGYPARGSQPFQPLSILRNLAGLEFPYMLHLSYHPAAQGSGSDANDESQQVAAMSGTGGSKDGIPLWGSHAQQQVLSAEEKESLARRRKEVEKKREENLAAIERRRADEERNAFQHAESYEVYRQEKLKKEQEQAEARRLAEEAKEEALRASQTSKLQGGDEDSEEDAAAQSKRVLNQHRLEMLRRVEEEKQRAVEVAKYREQRRLEQEEKRQQMQREKQRLLKEQQGARMDNALQEILSELDSKVGLNRERTEKTFTGAMQRRKELERTEADLRSIATLEAVRNEPKIAARAHRSNMAASNAQLQLRSASQQGDADTSRDEELLRERERWRQQQDDKQAMLESHLELHYRTVFEESSRTEAPLTNRPETF